MGWAADALTRAAALSPPAYQSPCGTTQGCVPQPGTAVALDTLSYGYLMYRLAYRRHEHYQSMVVNYTVDVGDLAPQPHVGVRWFELRKQHGAWSIYQHGDYDPDTNHRWIGSVAQDRKGNMALGYNVSGSAVFPSLAFAGRLAQDAPGTLSHETILKAGGGSQTGAGYIFASSGESVGGWIAQGRG